jgi:hypothetical protein
MLQGQDGLPATKPPAGYGLEIDWDGILTDDRDHSEDIVRRVRDVVELIWKDESEAIEKETCEIFGVNELRDYFRKPGKGGFWGDHVSRYSKSPARPQSTGCFTLPRKITPSGCITTGSTKTCSLRRL